MRKNILIYLVSFQIRDKVILNAATMNENKKYIKTLNVTNLILSGTLIILDFDVIFSSKHEKRASPSNLNKNFKIYPMKQTRIE
jgi:hypothetical protein